MTTPVRKITRTETTIPMLDHIDENGQPEAAKYDESESLRDYLSQFGADPFRIKVYRQSDTGAEEFCFTGGPQEVEEERIQSLYGGGNYNLRCFLKGVYQETINVRIAPPAKRKVDSDSTDSSSLESRLMREQNAFLQQMVLTTLQAGNKPATPISEFAELLKVANPNQKDPMDLILKGMDLAKSFSSAASPDWKTGMVDGVKDIAKSVLPVIAAQRMQQSQPQSQPQVQPMQPSQEDQLRAGIGYLKQQILNGMPVGLVVDWIAANANQPQYQPFVGMVLNQDFETFMRIDAELANEPYLSYFRTLHSGLREVFSQHDDESTDVEHTERSGRDTSNATSNGKPSKKSSK